jgi:putative ABC transport system permease protein
MAFRDELRHAARLPVREPWFAGLCVIMLALGIGANTAIFSIVNGVLLRPLPYRDPARLVSLREVIPAIASTYPTLPASARHFTEWRQRCSSFSSLSVMDQGTVNLTGAGEPERLQVARISANLFDTLGVQPSFGRGLMAGEDTEGRDRVVVISSSLWKRRFNGDPAVIGRTITLDGAGYAVVGVLPAGFRLPTVSILENVTAVPEQPEVFKPMVFPPGELKELMGTFNYNVVARLKDGVSRESATAELNVVAAQLEAMSGEKVNLKSVITPLQESIVGKSRRGLIVLLGAVGAVLLIVCVNLANLMLARAERRGREWAIRAALGASRARLVRQVLVETVLIAFLGGILGTAVAAASLGELIRHAPADIPRLEDVRLDGQVLLFAFAITTATGILFGLAPAWHSTHNAPQETLKSGSRTSAGSRQGARFRNTLLSLEVGLSTLLLVLAALLGESFMHVINADKGFRAPAVLSARVVIPATKYAEEEQRNRFHEQVLERLASEPGVTSAAITTALPLTGETWVDSAWVPGDAGPESERPLVNVRFVSPEYFRTMGIPLQAGRTFGTNDRNRNVAILSERLARRLWPNLSAIGRQITRSGGQLYDVIGVAGDVRANPDQLPVAMVYRPHWEWAPRTVMLVARSAGDPRTVASSMRAAIRSVDPDVAMPVMQTMQEILEQSVAQRRFQTLLAVAFGSTALLLAALGIYGVVSYSVARRTNEMGIRMALGAQPRRLLCTVIGQGMAPVAVGLTFGISASLAAERIVSNLLYGVTARDPVAIASAAALVVGISLAACWVPARRATKVNAFEALRYE